MAQNRMDASSMLLKCALTLLWSGLCTGQITFTSQPTNAVVPPSSPLQVSCTATTSLAGVLHILWKRNDTWIVDYRNKHYRQLSNGSLQFDQFLPADQGLYQCSALVIDASHNHLGQIYSQTATIKIAYIEDVFVINPETRSAQMGSNIQLQCLSPKSEPIAYIDWEKDNIKLAGYENGSVTLSSEKILSATILIKNLSSIHTGVYRCVAYNRLLQGKVVRSAGATVTIAARQEKPYFEKRPQTAIASRFHPFIWQCYIRGVPEPVVQWYHNGQAVVHDQNRVKLTSGALHFISVLEQYNGSYVCEGSNTLGKISSQPVAFVVAYPTSSILIHGETLLLHCTPPRSYPVAVAITWYKDYTPVVPGSTTSVTSANSLRVASVTRSAEGVYFCQAYNSVTKESRTSKTAAVTVRVLPRIQTVLVNSSAVVGATLTMNCTAVGYPSPSVIWVKGGAVLSNNETMVLSRVSLNDSGYYSCIATNSAGNDSKRFYLAVSSRPVANVVPVNKTRISGQPVEFHCDFVGTPKPITFWYFIPRGSFYRQPLVSGDRINRISSGIRINSVVKSDEGRFICSGNSTGGSAEVYAFLTVQVPPQLFVRPVNQTSFVSSSFTMRCAATGDPAPAITWLFNSHILSNGAKYRISSNNLTVNNVVIGDAGWYTCRVVNVAGNQTAMAFVDVSVGPSITHFSVPQQVRAGDTFIISCEGTGNPKPSIKWRRNSTFHLPIDGSRILQNRTNTIITQARSSDSGTYECVLENSLGRAARSASLIVQVLPHPPTIVKARGILSTAIEVLWSAGFDGFSNIIRYELEMLRQGTIQWQSVQHSIPGHMLNYTVNGLLPFTLYGFRMKAHTEIGPSAYSAIANARTLEDAPSIPLNVQVSRINATSAFVNWDPPAIPNGNITIYQLVYGAIGNSELNGTIVVRDKKAHFETEIKQLRPFTMYFLKIRAATLISSIFKWGNYTTSSYFTTLETVPSVAPKIQNVTALNSTSITVSISPFLASHTLWVFTGFLVTIEVGTDRRTINTNETHIIIASLSKATLYVIQAQACSRVGCGPKSKSSFVSTMEDVPGTVSNASAVAISSTSILVKWFEPSEKNGVITGYIVTIRNASRFYIGNFTLAGHIMELQKDGLPSNATYYVTIAAMTKIGIGSRIPEIVVKLRDNGVLTTPSIVTNATALPPVASTAMTTAATTATTAITTKSVITIIQSGSQKSVDWLDEKNLPILIGISVAIFILLIIVIVLIAWTFSRRVKSETIRRQRWLSTRTHSGAENPAYLPNGELELEKHIDIRPSEQNHNPEIIVDDTEEKQDDFVFESDSEPSQIIDCINPSNQYASDDTMRLKDDSSPLVKLRGADVDLSDAPSEKAYSIIGDSIDPIPDIFAFIDEEDQKSEKTATDAQSNEDPADFLRTEYVDSNDARHTPKLQYPGDQLSGRSPIPGDLAWDNYDTSRPIVHDFDEHGYAEPTVEHPSLTINSPSRSNRRTDADKAYLVDNEETII